jgi:hydrogenase maturation factor HypE
LPLEFSGEMGIVSRGTGDWFATEVILNVAICRARQPVERTGRRVDG